MGEGELQWQPNINNYKKTRYVQTGIDPQSLVGGGREMRGNRRLGYNWTQK